MLRNVPQCISSNLDLFYVDRTYYNFIQLVSSIRQNLSNTYIVKRSILSPRRVYQLEITLSSSKGQILAETKDHKKIVLQFIYTPSISNIQSYLMAFDLNISQVSYNGCQVFCTWSFVCALNTGTFICFNLTNEIRTLGCSALRIAKYCRRNFKLLCPYQF